MTDERVILLRVENENNQYFLVTPDSESGWWTVCSGTRIPVGEKVYFEDEGLLWWNIMDLKDEDVPIDMPVAGSMIQVKNGETLTSLVKPLTYWIESSHGPSPFSVTHHLFRAPWHAKFVKS